MPVEFDKLLSLQDCDRRIRQLTRESEDIPARKAEIEARLSSHKQALHDAEEDLKKHGLKVKELEGEIEGQHAKAAKYRTQQLSVKSNTEYRALENEIGTTEKAVLGLEDQELVVMEEMEALQENVRTRTKELKEEEATVNQDKASMDVRLKELEAEIARLQEELVGLREGVDAESLARYERIIEHVGDFAIVGVDNGTCEGCHMKIPPQLVHDSRKKDSLTICTYCGRILYSGS